MQSSFPGPRPEKGQSEKVWAKQYLDAAISYYENNSSGRKSKIQNLYDTHNGIVKEADKKFLVEKYGAKVSTNYVDFKLGRTKIKVLLGEYLTIDFTPYVYSTNKEAIASKADFANLIRGSMQAKEVLDMVSKNSGIRPLNGMKIPSESDPDLFEKLYPKTQNEIIMQVILDNELADQTVKLKGYMTIADMVIVSECFSKIEKDLSGKEVIEIYSPSQMIFQETPNDPFCSKSPFMGHWQYMFVKDILQKFELSETDKQKLKSEEEDTSLRKPGGWKIIGGLPAVPVYFLEWKSYINKYTKVTKSENGPDYMTDISESFYKKHKVSIENDIKAGKYTVDKKYQEVIYEGIRIGQTIYTGIKIKEYQIQTRDFLGKYRADFDYSGFLFGTIDGIRISLHELIYGLATVYNVIMFQIVREIRKNRGKVFVYDEAVRPKLKSMKSVFYDVEEHGVIRINSASDQNYSQTDVDNAVNLIKEIDLGLSQSFQTLIALKSDIEVTIDRITGINENREGLGKASQTATGAMQNIEASRSITKDLFFCHNLFMQETLRKLLEKRKTNWEWIDSMQGRLLLGRTMINHLKITRSVTNDDYGVYLTDGKKEKEIRDFIRPLFAQEINAGNLRSRDVIGFEMSRNLSSGISILENAWNEVQQIAARDAQMKDKINQDNIAANRQLAIEDREDNQAHEVQLKEMDLAAARMKVGAAGLMNEAKIEGQKDVSKNKSNV